MTHAMRLPQNMSPSTLPSERLCSSMEFHSAHSTLILPRRTEVGFLAGSASVWRCLATRLDLDDGEVTAALHHQVERLTQTSDEIATCARDEVVRQVRDVATDVVPPGRLRI